MGKLLFQKKFVKEVIMFGWIVWMWLCWCKKGLDLGEDLDCLLGHRCL